MGGSHAKAPGQHGHGVVAQVGSQPFIDALRKRQTEATARNSGALRFESRGDAVTLQLYAQREVLDAVQALKDPYRTTIFRRYFEGLGPQAIAERLAIPEKAVKTRLTRAHQMLRDRLSPRLQDSNGRWTQALMGFVAVPAVAPPAPVSLAIPLIVMKKVALIAATLLVGWFAYSVLTGDPKQDLNTAAMSGDQSQETPSAGSAADLQGEIAKDRVEVAAQNQTHGSGTAPLPLPPWGSLAVTVLDANGNPAANVTVVAVTKTDSVYTRKLFRGQTDKDGVAHFAQLAPDTYKLGTDRQREKSKEKDLVEVVQDQEVQKTLTLSAGLVVHGKVTDPHGAPVA